MIQATQRDATEKMQALLRRMTTPGWTGYVYDNLGWHYCIRKGPLTLYENDYPDSDGPKYSCLISTDPQRIVSLSFWSEDQAHQRECLNDPNACAASALRQARKVVTHLDAAIAEVETVSETEDVSDTPAPDEDTEMVISMREALADLLEIVTYFRKKSRSPFEKLAWERIDSAVSRAESILSSAL